MRRWLAYWLFWKRLGWTPAEVDEMPDYLVDYLVQHLAGAE